MKSCMRRVSEDARIKQVWLGTGNVLREFPMSSAHACVQSVRKNIREDMEDRWVTNLSEGRQRFYLVSSLLDPHTKILSFCDNKCNCFNSFFSQVQTFEYFHKVQTFEYSLNTPDTHKFTVWGLWKKLKKETKNIFPKKDILYTHTSNSQTSMFVEWDSHCSLNRVSLVYWPILAEFCNDSQIVTKTHCDTKLKIH